MDSQPPFVLDRKHVNQMLVHILRSGEVGSMDFSWLTTNWRIIDENLRAMTDSGLLRVRIPTKGRKALRYSLTDTGLCVAIAELLQQVCVSGTFDIADDMIHDDLLRLWNENGKLRRIAGTEDQGKRGKWFPAGPLRAGIGFNHSAGTNL